MLDLLNKIKLVLKKEKTSDFSYEKPTIKPIKDWVVILITAQVVIFILAVFAFYFYLKVDSGEFFTTINEPQDNEVKIDSELLKKTIENIEKREVDFNQARSGGIPGDPAI